MFAGSSGSSPMPRKMAGNEMMTMDPSTAYMNTPSVVLDRATHLYPPATGRCTPVVVVSTANQSSTARAVEQTDSRQSPGRREVSAGPAGAGTVPGSIYIERGDAACWLPHGAAR